MIFQPWQSPCFETLPLLTGPPLSLIVPSHRPPPPLESVRNGHELSSVLGRSQNLWLFRLQDTFGYHPFDAFEGETGSTLDLGVEHK